MRARKVAIATVPFHGDQLQAIQEGERVWVPLKRMCEVLGLDESTQARKLKEKAWAGTVMMTAPDARGRPQDHFCLDLESLPMWLATITPGRVRPEARSKIERYQTECARVLRDHFFGQSRPQAPALGLLPPPIARDDTPVGIMFERWTVLYETEPQLRRKSDTGKRRKFVCRCICGTEREVWAQDLVGGRSRGCERERCRNGYFLVASDRMRDISPVGSLEKHTSPRVLTSGRNAFEMVRYGRTEAESAPVPVKIIAADAVSAVCSDDRRGKGHGERRVRLGLIRMEAPKPKEPDTFEEWTACAGAW